MYVNVESLVLSWPDYVLFVGVLVLFATLRVFTYSKPYIRRRFRWFTAGNSRWSLDESEMSDYPRVEDQHYSASLGTTSLILFMAVIAVSNEAYKVGTQLIYLLIAHALAAVFMAHLYMPLFHELELNNVLEYLELRFNRFVRILGTFSSFFQLLFQMTFILCIPSLALAQLTAYPLWLSVLLCGFMSATYSGSSCFRLSLWGNVFQVLVALVAPVTIVALGIMHLGGFEPFWSKLPRGKLISFDSFFISPLAEYSFFTLVFGGLGVLLSLTAVHPIEIEQFSSTVIRRKAKIGIYVRTLISWVFFILLLVCGLISFGVLLDCNTKKIELTKHDDQILSAAIVVIGSKKAALKGFLLGSLFAGSFSAITSTASSISSLVVQEVTTSSVLLNVDKRAPGGIRRWITFFLCLLSIPITFGLSEIPTSLFRTAMTFAGALGGPLITIVCIGMFLPCISNLGAICGLFLSQLTGVALLVFKLYTFSAPGRQHLHHNSTSNCPAIFPVITVPDKPNIVGDPETVSILDYSFWYIPAICFGVGLLFSLLFSIPSKFNANKIIDDRYLAWPTRAFMRRGQSSNSQLVSETQRSSYNEDIFDEESEPEWNSSAVRQLSKHSGSFDGAA